MRLIFYFFILCIFACSINQKKSTDGTNFDTKAFFEEQIKLLHSQHHTLKKEMVFNGKTEEIKSDSINWAKELGAFASIDFLKPAYLGRFTKDSFSINENCSRTIYLSDEPKTDLKKVEVTYALSSNKITSIILEMNETNTIYQSVKKLCFYTDSAFSITGHQNIKLTEGISYSVKGNFNF